MYTLEKCNAAIHAVFNKYPGARLSGPYLAWEVMFLLLKDDRPYHAMEAVYKTALHAMVQNKIVSRTIGPAGGYARVCDIPTLIQAKGAAPIQAAAKEKPCKQCGRNNDIGVSKCWCCECSNP